MEGHELRWMGKDTGSAMALSRIQALEKENRSVRVHAQFNVCSLCLHVRGEGAKEWKRKKTCVSSCVIECVNMCCVCCEREREREREVMTSIRPVSCVTLDPSLALQKI